MENNSNFEPVNSALPSGLEAEPEAEILFNVTWIGLIQVNVDESGNQYIFSKDRNTIKM
ncbi:MAG: hypothetical protein WBC36_11925 [Desulfobacterales bacterium]